MINSCQRPSRPANHRIFLRVATAFVVAVLWLPGALAQNQTGVFYPADDGLHVRLNSLSVTETAATYRYSVSYTLENRTADRAIDEGSFKAYFRNSEGGTPQYGFFGRVFPNGTVNRSYQWEELKTQPFALIAYGSNLFFTSTPPPGAVRWVVNVPGLPALVAPTITTQPSALSIASGGNASFTVSAAGTAPLSYQWRRDNADLPGATSATLTLNSVQASNAGNYSVVVSNPAGSVTSASANLSVTPINPGRIINLSVRTGAGTGDSTLIVGIGIGGERTSGAKAVLLRGVGPTLSSFGVGGTLTDPLVTLFRGQTQVASNDDWAGNFEFSTVGAFNFAGTPVRDAAIYDPLLPANSYSVQITGKNNGTGIALAEVYDATPAAEFSGSTPRLVNVSARSRVGTGDEILIAGFVVTGATPLRVLVRAAGPTLSGFGVGGALQDPKLELFRGSTRIGENDNWEPAASATFVNVGAFPFGTGSRDAALVVTLGPGAYTAQVSGVNATTGVALVEVYEVP